MSSRTLLNAAKRHWPLTLTSFLVLVGATTLVIAQQREIKSVAFYEDAGEGDRKIELSVGTSRVLTFDYDIPKVVINDGIVTAKPVSPNQIMLQAIRPGIASLYVHNSEGQVQTVEVVVLNDVRPLSEAIEALFPAATIRVRPLSNSVVLTGYASSTEQVKQIMDVARDYFPTAINQIQVDGNFKVLLNAKVFEVSRTKLRKIGIDWAAILSDDFLISRPGGSLNLQNFFNQGNVQGSSTVVGGVVSGGNQFLVLLDLLEQNNLAKILADTQLVADSGRAASLLSGGEIPIPISNGFATSIDFREFGTSLDCVPIVQADGLIRLEILAEVRDVAGDLRDAVTGTPGFRTRSVNTAVTVPAGRTIAIAGIIQNRSDSDVRGIPYLMDMPWVGTLFRRSVETVNEVDLVVVIRPEFVGSIDPAQLPAGPGTHTVSPREEEFYLKGYIEVPSCCPSEELGPMLPFDAGLGTMRVDESYETVPSAEQEGTGIEVQPAPDSSASSQSLFPYGRGSTYETSPAVEMESFPSVSARGSTFTVSDQPPMTSPAYGQPPANSSDTKPLLGPIGYDSLR